MCHMTQPNAPIPARIADDLEGAAEEVQYWTKDRDRLICELRKEGISLRRIGKLANLSDTAIAHIIRRDMPQDPS